MARSSKSKSDDIVAEDTKLYLTEGELRLLEVGDLEAKLRMREKQLKERDMRILQLGIELQQEKLNTLNYSRLELDRLHKDKLKEHKNKVDQLREKYGVGPEDSWGHDPISGEIIIDRKE